MSLALSTLHSRDRVNIVEPGRLHPAVSFARASTATYMGPAGTLLTAAANAPRYEYDSLGNYLGLLIEQAQTNALLNSATVATQNITVTAAARTLSFYGTGTITLSGTFSGSLVGTGASNRVTLTFTPAAGTLTLTVSGSCTNGQLETGAFATSYIPTTSAAVTRSADVAQVSNLALIGYNALAGSMLAAVVLLDVAAYHQIASFDDGTTNNRISALSLSGGAGSGSPRIDIAASGVISINSLFVNPKFVAGVPGKCVSTWDNTGASVVSMGGTAGSVSATVTMPAVTQLVLGNRGGGGGVTLNGRIKSLTYYARRLPNSELQRLTA